MNLKYRINASRAAYRKAKNYQATNSHYLRDLVASQLHDNHQRLARAELSFNSNEMQLPTHPDSEPDESRDDHHVAANKLYTEFI